MMKAHVVPTSGPRRGSMDSSTPAKAIKREDIPQDMHTPPKSDGEDDDGSSHRALNSPFTTPSPKRKRETPRRAAKNKKVKYVESSDSETDRTDFLPSDEESDDKTEEDDVDDVLRVVVLTERTGDVLR